MEANKKRNEKANKVTRCQDDEYLVNPSKRFVTRRVHCTPASMQGLDMTFRTRQTSVYGKSYVRSRSKNAPGTFHGGAEVIRQWN